MISQTHKLDVVPGGVTAVVHVKQYQTGESLVFELFSRFGDFEISAAYTECTVRGTKSDGNGYSANATCDPSNNSVTVELTEQMTAVAGRQPYEITITESTGRMITTTFILDVHRAALDADTVESESVIKEVQTIVEEYIEDHPGLFVVDPTLTQSGESADAKVTGDEIADLKSGLNRYADYGLIPYTPIRGTLKTGFISATGVENTTNTNYCHFDFDIPKGTKKVYFQPWRTYGTGSSYSCLAYYDENGTFISSVTNAEINPSASTVIVQTYEGDVPPCAVKATVTFVANQNQLGNVVFYGYYDIQKHTRTLNNHLSGDSNMPLYLQVVGCLPYSQISNTRLSLTAKIKCSKNPLSYDVYVVGYDSSYANRVICGYFSGMTRGLSGNTIDINFNAYNKDNTLANKHYVGFLVNIKYDYDGTRPDYVQSFYRFTNEIVHEIEYFYINGVDVSANVFHIGGETSNLNISTNAPHNPLYGGRLCTIGDSLTAVYYKLEEESWPYLIAKWNNMKLDNLGISGNPMAKTSSYTENLCMAERVDELDANKYYTHIFVMGGANDYNFSIPIGTNSDTVITTFKGAINHIIDTLIQKFPFAHIVFATTYQRTANKADQPYADAMLEVCESRCIPCLDNYRKSGVLFFNERWMQYHGATHALGNNHLSAAGDAFVAPRFEQALKYGVQ